MTRTKTINSNGIAIFAAGCFWGVEDYFSRIPGVISTEVGYTGGHTENPTYKQVCSSRTGHAEAIKIEFDPQIVSYVTLLNHFFRMHDPTTLNRQGPDVGSQYRSAIFYLTFEQQKQAESVKSELNDGKHFRHPIVSEITQATTFYPAEKYHQKYTQKTGYGGCHIQFSNL